VSWGILRLLGSVTILVLALPPALAGVELLFRGNLLVGGGLLGAALTMVVLDQYVTTPSDLPELVVGKLRDALVGSPDEE
jgi:hypothetical protein